MADKRIQDFPTLSEAQDTDLILVGAQNDTYNMSVGTLKTAAREAATEQTSQAVNAAQQSQAASVASRYAAEEAQQAAEETARAAARMNIDPDDLGLEQDTDTGLVYPTYRGVRSENGIPLAATGGGGGGGGGITYTVTLRNDMDGRTLTIPEGGTAELIFTYTSVDADGYNDGDGVGSITIDGIKAMTFKAVQGENTVDISAHLTQGEHTVKLVVSNSEGVKKTLSYTVTVATARLTSSFDASTPFTGDIPFVYTPTAIADKLVHFELDGEELGTEIVTSSGRQRSYTIPAQSHGAHTLRVWFECEIYDTSVTSNVISVTFMCVEDGNTTPIIAISTEASKSVEQFANIVTKYRVYNPAGLTAAITLEVNGETVSSLTVDRTEQTWTYRPTEVGSIEQTIRCGGEYASWTYTVTESSIKVEAETEALALYLSSYGRSNSEENPGVWESGNISAEFQNFNFVSDGWQFDEDDNSVLRVTGDARLHIPYRMFASDFRTTGKTIEFEMATREVLNYDTEVINCFSGGRGFSITAQQLKLASEQSQMGTRYKEDEHLRVTFVVEKSSANRLILCYINGIMSGAAQYPAEDDFSQLNPVGITIGSNYCTTDLYNIRVYDNALTRYQVLDNWIADTQNPEDKLARYLRNQIYDDFDRVVITQLPTDLCYMVLECPELPQFKDDVKPCNGYFVDLVNPSRSFTFEDAEIDVQGTSSQYYYVKNYKIKFKGGFILSNGSTVTVYQMNNGAVPVDTFTMKADVASSESAFNVVLAMLYHDLCPYKTPAQQADTKIRQTIEGFPMVMFWNNGTETKFLGKYNFNNDKGTHEVFGFKSGDESWEILQNGTERVGWHSADFSDGWQDDFEARYPKKNTNITKLRALAEWLVSTDTDQATGNAITPVTYGGVEYTTDTVEYRLAKFSAELADHFVEEAIIFYYLFTEVFLSIDQREKNAFPTYIASLDRWIVLFYDADSSCGTDNKGNLTFDYYLEDIDYTQGGDPVYNGQNSVLWKNLRETRSAEIAALYKELRTRTSNGISYDSVIGRFEAHQSKWPEAIFNEDMHRKCLEPLIEEGDGLYIPMLQGKKEQWMKWWLYNRFRYLDSKYETGTSMTNRITIRAHQKANVFLTPYVNMYGRVYFNAAMVEHRMERNKEYEFEWPASGAEDPVIGINDADLLTSLGDMSPHMVELIDVSGAPHITELKLGDSAEGYKNYSLNSITLGNNILLRTLDLRNCPNLTQSVGASGCTNIEEVYLDGTSVTGVSLPNGGILKVLHLPDTVTNLTVLNQKAITDFTMAGYSNVTTLRVENSPAIPAIDILNVMPANSRVRIIGFDIEAEDGDDVISFLSKLGTMRGLDENGNNVDNVQVSGSIHATVVATNHVAIINEAKVTYPGLHITYDEVRDPIVRFYNGDTLLQTVEGVVPGATVTYTGVTPTKPGAEVPEDWKFMGWSPESTNVQRDMDCYAQFAYAGYKTIKLVERTISGAYENDRVQSVGSYVFYCARLTSVSMPNVTSIGTNAFNNAQTITDVYFPAATTIESQAFYNCFALKKADLSSVTRIAGNAFAMCHSLTSLIIRSNGIATLSNTNVFSYCFHIQGTTNNKYNPNGDKDGYIYVPRALLSDTDAAKDYRRATNWSTYATQFRAIEDYPEICGGV